MGKYLKATDGVFRNEMRDEWQLGIVSKLLMCTNNAAERPFGVGLHENLSINESPYFGFLWLEHV